MCLEVTVELAGASSEEAQALAHALDNESTLAVRTFRPRRWLHEGPSMIAISEEGACGCSLLADESPADSPFWIFRDDVRGPLADVVESLRSHYSGNMIFLATFGGDKPKNHVSSTADELAQFIRADILEETTAYRVAPRAV